MGLLHVDESKCKKDGICAAECPSRIIHLKDGDGVPEVSRADRRGCIVCGHCVAVCPHGALSHEKVPIEACPSFDKTLGINEAQAVQFLRSRRSIRVFKDQPVEPEKIQRAIEIARYAPTGSNSQVVQWLLMTDKEEIHQAAKLTAEWMRRVVKTADRKNYPAYFPAFLAGWDAGHDLVLRNTPVLVVASAPKEHTNGLVDVTIALSHLELAALPLGLGTCWAGLVHAALLQDQPLKDLVGLPEGHTHCYPMMLGYPKFKYHRLPERKPPRIVWR